MAYVRINDYKKQQMTALNLYKVFPKSQYYFWAVMSIYMQTVNNNDESMSSNIILPLAEKMCEKFLKENKFEKEAQFELYFLILAKQKKYSEMINLIDTLRNMKNVIKHDFGYYLHYKSKLLKSENRLEEAFECLKELILSNNDQFEYYIEAFDLADVLDEKITDENEKQKYPHIVDMLKLTEKICVSEKTKLWDFPENGHDFEDSLTSKLEEHCPRGPFMARIIITDLLKKNQYDSLKDSFNFDLVHLMLDYYKRFGQKFVCVKDIMFLIQNMNLPYEKVKMKFFFLN